MEAPQGGATVLQRSHSGLVQTRSVASLVLFLVVPNFLVGVFQTALFLVLQHEVLAERIDQIIERLVG